jgi:hypothetical protein
MKIEVIWHCFVNCSDIKRHESPYSGVLSVLMFATERRIDWMNILDAAQGSERVPKMISNELIEDRIRGYSVK